MRDGAGLAFKHSIPRPVSEGLLASGPIHWAPDAKNQFLGKDPDAGKD